MPTIGVSPCENEALPTGNQPSSPNEKYSLEMIPRKKPKKSEAFINTCVSLIKQQWKKMIKVPQKRDFLIC